MPCRGGAVWLLTSAHEPPVRLLLRDGDEARTMAKTADQVESPSISHLPQHASMFLCCSCCYTCSHRHSCAPSIALSAQQLDTSNIDSDLSVGRNHRSHRSLSVKSPSISFTSSLPSPNSTGLDNPSKRWQATETRVHEQATQRRHTSRARRWRGPAQPALAGGPASAAAGTKFRLPARRGLQIDFLRSFNDDHTPRTLICSTCLEASGRLLTCAW